MHLPSCEIDQIEIYLKNTLAHYGESASKQLIPQIFFAINALIKHEDFDGLKDKYCHYYKMRIFWQWQYKHFS